MSPPRALISAARIRSRVRELAREIDTAYASCPEICLMATLRGAFVFTADLVRELRHPVTIDFLRVSSYAGGTDSSGTVTWLLEPDNVRARHVLVVEDIVDTGITLDAIRTRLLAHRPASLRTVTLLDKPARRARVVPIEFRGFTIEDVFVVGYGMDADGRHRELPYLAVDGTASVAPAEPG